MEATAQLIVDLEDSATWPDPVAAFTERWAEQLRGSTEFTSDLEVPLELEVEFRAVFAGRPLLLFHATCLFDHEVEVIKSEGLRQLTLDLVEERIAAAHKRGLLTDEERDQCLSQNVYAIRNTEGRENQVCGVIGRGIFDDPEHGWGLHPFLGGWGGEAMHGGPGPDSDTLLQRLGHPAIVAAVLDIAAADARVFPSLARVFVGRALGLQDAFAAIHLLEDLPGENILGIWQPGHPEYDAHRELPRDESKQRLSS